MQIQDATKAKTSDTVVFAGPPVTEQVLWPRHCVQESWGAEFHKDLKVHWYTALGMQSDESTFEVASERGRGRR